MPKPQDIFQLAQQEAVRVTASPQAWQSFLYTAAHNYHTTYLNQLLIHAQRPDAAACASMEYWNKQANRLVMRGSTSITVLQRRQGVAVTKPVFAIGDTTLLSQTRTGGPWEVTDTTRPLLLQGKSDDWLAALAQDGVSNEADRARRMLERNVADSTLQWAQPDEQMQLLQALVTQSAVYIARMRIGLPVRDEDYLAFQSVSQFDTYQISLCLGGYLQAAAEPMLNAIGREALRLNRDSIAIPHEPVHNESTPTQLNSREEAVTHDVQSIDVSLGMRMSAFNIPSIMKICEDDTLHLEELASDKKVALFVVTPDTTTAYNFLAAVMFQQCFQILVHTADNREDHCLPRHVRFLLDEFPNIGMIPDFQILISTIRSRNIGCTLIYQSIAQLKSQYGDDWGTILENCDSELVLGGGNNPESLEFFGKQLGKRTIEVLNTTENLGAQGSFSKNYQVASRDLMTPEEIRTMPRNRCLLMISGVVPFYSYKFDLKKHPNYALVEKEGHHPFNYERRAENSFAAFMKNVQEINNIELDDDESDT